MRSQSEQAVPYLKAWRLKRLMTQLQLAVKADVGQQTVIRIEKGAKASELTIHKLARALDITVKELLEQDPEKEATA